MWNFKQWNFKDYESIEDARQAMQKFINKRLGRIQYCEVFINNGFAIEYRRLKRVY